MFDQADAPLKILHHAALGDPLFVLGEMAQAEVAYHVDPRVAVLTRAVEDLRVRVQALEQQTPRAYLHRLGTYLVETAWTIWDRVRALWP